MSFKASALTSIPVAAIPVVGLGLFGGGTLDLRGCAVLAAGFAVLWVIFALGIYHSQYGLENVAKRTGPLTRQEEAAPEAVPVSEPTSS